MKIPFRFRWIPEVRRFRYNSFASSFDTDVPAPSPLYQIHCVFLLSLPRLLFTSKFLLSLFQRFCPTRYYIEAVMIGICFCFILQIWCAPLFPFRFLFSIFHSIQYRATKKTTHSRNKSGLIIRCESSASLFDIYRNVGAQHAFMSSVLCMWNGWHDHQAVFYLEL